MTPSPLSSVRRWITAALMLVVAAFAVLAISNTASAGAVPEEPPGDNGDVKVHEWTTPEDDQRNEPQVCVFYLVGFNFDAVEQVSWKIKSWPPTGDKTTVKSGTLVLDEDGHGRTADMTLPNGHYKLFWTFGEKRGAPKHKAFWVGCESTPTPTPTPTPSQTPTSSQSPIPSQTPTVPPTSTPTATPTVTSTPTPTPTSPPSPSPTPTPTHPGKDDHPTVTQEWIEWDANALQTQEEPKPAPTPTPVKTDVPVTG